MDTNEKQHLSPAERRRRTEMRKRRQKELQRKKRKKLIMIILCAVLGTAVLAGIIFGVSRLMGSPEISAKGDTFVIAIDPGHGGEDTGMTAGDITEKAVDMKICSKLKIMLESQGYQVIMTREEDTRLSKEERVKLANESGADLLVSVHCNYAEGEESISGARTSFKDGNKKSKALAENVQAALVKETGASDGGIQEADYTILSDAGMPAVLVEAGYLSNEAEAAKLGEDTYQNDVAKGIAKGILMSLKEN